MGQVRASLIGLTTLAACSAPLTDEECYGMLDRYTELLILDENPTAVAQDIAGKQHEARERARTDPRHEFALCRDKVRRSQYECAMKAPTVNAVEQCLAL